MKLHANLSPYFWCCAASLCSVCSMPTSAQSIADYQRASEARGCELIPYEGARDRCRQEQADANQWCTGEGSFSCTDSDLNPGPVAERLSNLERALQNAESKNDRSEVSRIKQAIDEAKRELENRRKESSRRLYVGEKCLDFRKRTQAVYREAESRLVNDGSDSSKEAARPAIGKVLDKIRSEYSGHAQQISGVSNAVATCRR